MAALELPAVLALAPVLLFPVPGRLVLLVVVPIIWLCAWASGDGFLPRTPMNASIHVLLAMVGVSLFVTPDVQFSLGKVCGVVLGSLLFWAITRVIGTPRRLRWGALAFMLAGAGLAIIGLVGAEQGSGLSRIGVTAHLALGAVRGLRGAEDGFNPNAVAGCLVLFLPLQLTTIGTGIETWLFPAAKSARLRRFARAGHVALIGVTAGTFLLMRSRGAWLGMFGAAVVLLAWRIRRARMPLAVAACASLIVTLAVGPQRMMDLARRWSGPSLVYTISIREELWSRAFDGIRDVPLTGMGMNTFRRVMTPLPSSLGVPLTQDLAHAHNNLLQTGLDLGIPGLVAYASIWLLSAALLVSAYRRSFGSPTHQAIAVGLGAGLLAQFVFGLTDAIPLGSKVGVFFWGSLALSVGLHRVATTETCGQRAAMGGPGASHKP